MNIKLLTEQHFEFLSLTGGFKGSSESTLVKIPHCWKSHVTAQLSQHTDLHLQYQMKTECQRELVLPWMPLKIWCFLKAIHLGQERERSVYCQRFLTLFLRFTTIIICSLICLFTLVVYIANNIDQDQTAPSEVKTESCISAISSDWLIRRIIQV